MEQKVSDTFTERKIPSWVLLIFLVTDILFYIIKNIKANLKKEKKKPDRSAREHKEKPQK